MVCTRAHVVCLWWRLRGVTCSTRSVTLDGIFTHRACNLACTTFHTAQVVHKQNNGRLHASNRQTAQANQTICVCKSCNTNKHEPKHKHAHFHVSCTTHTNKQTRTYFTITCVCKPRKQTHTQARYHTRIHSYIRCRSPARRPPATSSGTTHPSAC